jgi:LysR family transcriptional regulator for bpeEF and oprC
MDRLQSMEVFRWVADLGSFSRAADRLDLGKATVTAHVAQLEQRLGVKLLNRTTRRLSLTDDGAVYLEHVRRVLADVEEMDTALARGRSVPRGRLRVDMPAAIGRLLIVPALPRFAAQYPELSIVIQFSDLVADLVEEGIDAAIRVGTLGDSSLIARRVYDLRWITCASPEYLDRMGTPATPADLARHDCIGFWNPNQRRALPWRFEREGVREEFTPGERIALGTPEAVLDLAIAGGGIVQLGDIQVAPPIAAGRLVPILADRARTDTTPVSVVYPQGRHLSAKVRAFADFAAGLFPRPRTRRPTGPTPAQAP